MKNGDTPLDDEIIQRLKRIEEAVLYLIENAAQTQSTVEGIMSCVPELMAQTNVPSEQAAQELKENVEELYLKYLLVAQDRFGLGFWRPPNQS